MSDRRRELGMRAEEMVAARLAASGWRLLERNARPGEVRGELDVVALDGDQLVFVEVKARSAERRSGPATPLEAVSESKRRRIRALAAAWLRARSHRPAHRAVRFDVIALELDPRERPRAWEHVRGAF